MAEVGNKLPAPLPLSCILPQQRVRGNGHQVLLQTVEKILQLASGLTADGSENLTASRLVLRQTEKKILQRYYPAPPHLPQMLETVSYRSIT